MTLDTLARRAAAEVRATTEAAPVPEWKPRPASSTARWLGIAAAALLLMGVAAAMTGRGASTDVVAGEGIPTREELVARTQEIVTQKAAGDFHSMRQYFTEQVEAGVPEVTMQGVWAQAVAQRGGFLRQEQPEVTTEGDVTVVRIPLAFERGGSIFTVHYNRRGLITGLTLRPYSSIGVPPALAAKDAEALSAIVAGDFERARRDFSPKVADGLSASRLESVWRAVVAQRGGYLSRAHPQAFRLDQYVVLNSVVTFERGRMQFRTTWDAAGQIVGIYFLNPGASPLQ